MKPKRALLFLLFVWAGASVQGQSAADLLAPGQPLKNATVPFYAGANHQLAMMARIERGHTEYEQHGFFQIGLWPIGVLEGVSFDLKEPSLATNSMARLQSWLEPHGGITIELHKASFQISSTTTNRLEAGRVRVTKTGVCELLDEVTLISGGQRVTAPRAVWQLTGPHAGKLVLATVPPATNQFPTILSVPTSTPTLAHHE